MGVRAHSSPHRCPDCRLHLSLCFCEDLEPIPCRTHVAVLMHHIEANKTTNSGRLAAKVVNGHAFSRNPDLDEKGVRALCRPGDTPILLFPHEDALPIDQFKNYSTPLTLIVPDGNWRQAAKLRKRFPGLAEVTAVSLPHDEAPSIYRLRTGQREGGVSTMEAVARALGVLEGPRIRTAVETYFRMMVERTLWLRGRLPAEQITDGLPEGVTRHDPLSGLQGSDQNENSPA